MVGFAVRDGALIPQNSKLVVTLLIAASCVFATTTGYDAALMSGLNIIPAYKNYFKLDNTTKSLLTSASFIGCTPAAFVFAPISNRIGRKKVIVISAVIKIIGLILMASAQNYGMFLTGRILLGVGAGASGTSAPVWLAETLPYKIRGNGLSLNYAVWYIGSLIASGVTYGTSTMSGNLSWRIPAAIQAVFSVLCLLLIGLTPESSRWLAYQGRSEESLQVIAMVCANGDTSDPVVVTQHKEIMDTLSWEKEHIGSLSFAQTVRTPAARKRVMLACSVAIITMLSGNNVISYYLGDMLDQAGITNSRTQLQINICLSAFCLVCALCGSQVIDKFGRKTIALASMGCLVVFIFLVGGLTKAYASGTNISGVYATVAMIFLFQGSYSFGLTNLTALYPSEILNYSTRATGLSIFLIAVNSSGILVTFAFPLGLAAISYRIYFINGAWDILEFLFIAFCWVETKNMTLEQIDKYFDGQKHSDAEDIEVLNGTKVDEEDNLDITANKKADIAVVSKTDKDQDSE